MKSIPVVHIELQRLLGATERLVREDMPAFLNGEHREKFRQFVAALEENQAQLHASLETNPSAMATLGLTTSCLDEYGRRIDVLRHKRDKLQFAHASGACEPQTALASAQSSAMPNVPTGIPAAVAGGAPASTTRLMSHSGRGEGGERVGMRGGGSHGTANLSHRGREEPKQVEEQEPESEAVAKEIAEMAGRLKESSMGINRTLQTQTRVLDDTGDIVLANVGKVKRENARVAERLRKKRQATCASWTMMILVIVTFLVTYILVIMPFEKRRGPFILSAHATPAPTLARGVVEDQRNSETAETATGGGAGPGAEQALPQGILTDKAEIRAAVESAKKKMEETGQDVSKREAHMNKVKLKAAKEKEEARARSRERMYRNAADRRANRQREIEEGVAGLADQLLSPDMALSREGEGAGVGDEVDSGAGAGAGSVSLAEETDGSQLAGVMAGDSGQGESAPEPLPEDVNMPQEQGGEGLRRQEDMVRSRSMRSYEEASRRATAMHHTTNEGLRMVAEEKEKAALRRMDRYRQAALERMRSKETGEGYGNG
ncbi:unnamed protein product, partial [Discosporangium mesarthrocarpum]